MHTGSARLVVSLIVAQTFVRGCLNVLIVVAAFQVFDGGAAQVGYLTAAIGVGRVDRGDRSDDAPRRPTRCSLRALTGVLGRTDHVDGRTTVFRGCARPTGDRRRGQQRRGRRCVHAPPAACPESHADAGARTRLGSRDGWSCRRLHRRTCRGRGDRTSAGFRGRRVDPPAARAARVPEAHRDRQDRRPGSGARADRSRPVVRSALDRNEGTGRGEPSPDVVRCGRGRHPGRRRG